MRQAVSHWRKSISEPIALGIISLGCLLFAIAGPFGTQAGLGFVDRLLLWTPIVSIGGAVSLFLRICLRLWFREALKGWVETATVGLIVVLFGPIMLLWSRAVAMWFGLPEAMPSNTEQLIYLAITAGSFLWLRNVLIHFIGAEAEKRIAPVEEEPEFAPRLTRRIERDLVAPVLSIRADGHFVDVVTRKGTARIRMRLTDAIDEMEGVEGYCTHRSYWVAKSAVRGASRAGSVWRLTLENGDEIPVSRKYQPDLECAGLLRAMAAE